MGKKVTFLRHDLTVAAMERLSGLQKGEICSYGELATILGCEPQLHGYGFVKSARDILTSKGYVFAPVAGVGIKRLTDQENRAIALPAEAHPNSGAARLEGEGQRRPRRAFA